MLADENLISHRSCNRILLVRSDSDHVSSGVVHHHWQGRKTTRAAEHKLAPGHDAHYRVVHVSHDRPIMHKEKIGDAP